MRIGFAASEYDRPALKWTQSSFVQPQMMAHDRYFFDAKTNKYTVDRYLQDLKRRYGGIDSVLIWHTYPNIGIDSRSQFDLFRDLPGGTEGVRRMVDDFHRAGVRVLFPVMVWDRGTHEENTPDWQAISEELVLVNADGINGDTLDGMPRAFRKASDALNHPLALEPENGLSADEMIAYNNMTWGYWTYDFIPSVSRYKWLETRHMVNICNRWAHNHLDDLQEAFFNGTGFESWESIWGIWNQMTSRDAEALRRISLIERAYSGLLTSSQWQPHTPTLTYGVFASKWPGNEGTLWTIVNRNHYPVAGDQMVIADEPAMRYFDLWHGVELKPMRNNSKATLSFELESEGYGAVLAVKSVDTRLQTLLETMMSLAAKPLQSFSDKWVALPQALVPIEKTAAPTAPPAGMVRIPAAQFRFRINGIEIEGMNDEGVDVQYPWETSARRYHDHELSMKSFWIDQYPVTNAEFKKFLEATHYTPGDAHNFLKDWSNGNYPAGWDNKPVTWVSIEDARAYAQWGGKRLPHEWEWQYAAQGTDGRKYPWGNTWDPSTVPAPDKGRDIAPPSDVTAHPSGASVFGVKDLVGNVWQWTEEVVDEHTRNAILRGGSHYQPQGARWYFPRLMS